MNLDWVLEAYKSGAFPMADTRDSDEVSWYVARKRGIFPLEAFHMPRRALRHFRSKGFERRVDAAFGDVIAGCANRTTTWINHDIEELFNALHEEGHAHSIEVWRDDTLVGGLYGLSIGRAFFAESIFQTEPEAMKAALWFTHQWLKENGYGLWDVQFQNDFLKAFGSVEVSEKAYQKLLKAQL